MAVGSDGIIMVDGAVGSAAAGVISMKPKAGSTPLAGGWAVSYPDPSPQVKFPANGEKNREFG